MILIETQKEEFSKIKDIRVFGKDDQKGKTLNGDLLVVGLGGAGAKVVCALKGMLADELTPEDNINFLMIDSSIPEMEQTIEDSKEGIGLNALEVISVYRPNLATVLENGINANPVHPNLAKWMREDFPHVSIGTEGAGGNRQIGRLMFSNAYEDMRILLFEKLDEVHKKSKSGRLDVIVVASTAGGTGSGILADVTYNLKAYARSKKWEGFRIGACLMTPDVFFAEKWAREDDDKKSVMLANGCATLKEVDYLMRIANRGEAFSFESTTHRLTMRENIFDSCLLISGKKDEQGYIPSGTIFMDLAYFLRKICGYTYIGGAEGEEGRKLLRESIFDTDGQGYFKVVNESDYLVPIKEIENICEYEIFSEAYKRITELPPKDASFEKDIEDAFGEIKTFLNGKPGDEISLEINGLIKMGQFEKPIYKLIKKGQDDLRNGLPRQLSRLEQNIPVVVKSIKNKMTSTVEEHLRKYMEKYGPFVTMDIIGSAGVGHCEEDSGMIAEIKKLEAIQKEYKPNNEYGRIVESILDIVAKRFFTFPGAKRETENGYYENMLKDALAKERTLIMDGLDAQDVFGDLIRLLRDRAERLSEIYSQFGADLKTAVEELSIQGKKTTGYLLKGARQSEFLPSDYVTEDRINQMREGVIRLMVEHESDIDNGRVVPVRQEMEQIYKNLLLSIGAYGPEKLIATAFADKRPTLAEINMMFVQNESEMRDELMTRAAKAFVYGAKEKTEKKLLCTLKDGFEGEVINKKYISLPSAMPYFSEAAREIMTSKKYQEASDSITLNPGEMVISIDDIFLGVPLSMLACAEEMQKAYDAIDRDSYMGLHTDEVLKDMWSYPNLI